MKLTMLGTGSAMVTECYNTCFVLSEGRQRLLVDGGGGNGIFLQLNRAGIDVREIRDIFVTHKHADHILGIVWMIRMLCQNMSQGNYEGEARIYAHEEVIGILDDMVHMLFWEKQTRFIFRQSKPGEREAALADLSYPCLRLIPIEDGQEQIIIGHKFTFFDIRSTKDRQFGFSVLLDENERLTCSGDETCHEHEYQYAAKSKWLMHEAFCLASQADVFRPYEKHHSTVKDACILAEHLQVQNLILYHTEDKNMAERKARYEQEGREYYSGNLYIPADLEEIAL